MGISRLQDLPGLADLKFARLCMRTADRADQRAHHHACALVQSLSGLVIDLNIVRVQPCRGDGKFASVCVYRLSL